MSLSRLLVDGPDGIARLAVLCGGCIQDLRPKLANARYVIRDFGAGPGYCEFCAHEVLMEVGEV